MSVTRRRDSAERPGGAARRGNLNFGLRLGLELQVHWPKPESRSQLKITQAAGITRVTGITRVKVIFQSLRVTDRGSRAAPPVTAPAPGQGPGRRNHRLFACTAAPRPARRRSFQPLIYLSSICLGRRFAAAL